MQLNRLRFHLTFNPLNGLNEEQAKNHLLNTLNNNGFINIISPIDFCLLFEKDIDPVEILHPVDYVCSILNNHRQCNYVLSIIPYEYNIGHRIMN